MISQSSCIHSPTKGDRVPVPLREILFFIVRVDDIVGGLPSLLNGFIGRLLGVNFLDVLDLLGARMDTGVSK